MKAKNLYIALFSLLFAVPAMAQPPENANVEAVRIAYITRKLSLTPDEAKVFWPVYDAYQAELKSLREGQRDDITDARKNFETMSDKEIEAVVDKYLTSRQKELDLTLKYNGEFKQVLPIRKVAQLYRAEQEFTKLLLQRLQERRESGGVRPGGGPGMRGRF
jgi:Skp family chaperone for outer membrane proteins